MEFILDNPEVEREFQAIIRAIPAMQNGQTVESMKRMGLNYERNWGVSIVDLKLFASKVNKNHLLALKLWNKKWRETQILATLIEEPSKANEEQIDFWVKTAEHIEIVEQCAFNVMPYTPFAFAKSMEWLLSKKQNVKIAGLLTMGRLAMTDRNAIDEMFEPYFELLLPLSKDKALTQYIYRTYCQLARRSPSVHTQCLTLLDTMRTSGSETAQALANELHSELTSDFYNDESIFISKQ